MPAAFYVVFCFSLFINDKTFLVYRILILFTKYCLLFCFTKQKRASDDQDPGAEDGVLGERAQGSPGGAGGPAVRAGQTDQLCHR